MQKISTLIKRFALVFAPSKSFTIKKEEKTLKTNKLDKTSKVIKTPYIQMTPFIKNIKIALSKVFHVLSNILNFGQLWSKITKHHFLGFFSLNLFLTCWVYPCNLTFIQYPTIYPLSSDFNVLPSHVVFYKLWLNALFDIFVFPFYPNIPINDAVFLADFIYSIPFSCILIFLGYLLTKLFKKKTNKK